MIFGSPETIEYLISKGGDLDNPISVADGDTLYAIDIIKNKMKSIKPSRKSGEYLKHIQLLNLLRERGCDSSMID